MLVSASCIILPHVPMDNHNIVFSVANQLENYQWQHFYPQIHFFICSNIATAFELHALSVGGKWPPFEYSGWIVENTCTQPDLQVAQFQMLSCCFFTK